jgi:hypothetical protein
VANWFWLLFFSAAWLAPVTWHGLLHRPIPGAPRIFDSGTDLSCLFVTNRDYVPVQYFQVLLPGEGDWRTEEDAHYLRMSPFGARTRFDEMLRRGLGGQQRVVVELTSWIRAMHGRRTGVEPVAVRIVTGIVLQSPAPAGKFVKPRLEQIPIALREAWFTAVFAPAPEAVLRKNP